MKITTFILFALCTNCTLWGQNNCINDISTNPNAPSNNQLPFPSTDPNGDQRFINTFPWYAYDENNPIPLNNMSSVYDPPEMTHLTFDSHQYYHYISSGEELTPENGWELMLFNTGYFPDQSVMNTTGHQDIPYIVLYNRFTGILRVFGTYGNSPLQNPGGTVFDGVQITIVYDLQNELNGNLRLRNGNDVPLDQNTEVSLTKSTALHTNAPSQWFSADFQLAYDPCICFYPSKLRLQLDFYSSYSLKLYGRSIGAEEDIATGNTLLTNDYLTNFQFTGDVSEDQIVMYKVMGDFVDDYIKNLEKYKENLAATQEYNKEIDRKLFVMNLFKAVVINGLTLGTSSFVGLNWFQDGVEFVDEFIPGVNSDTATVNIYRSKLEEFAKKAIGAGVETFIKKNFQKQPTPSRPDAPTASFTEYNMKGELGQVISRQMPAFFTPGTYGSIGTLTQNISSPLEYPIYNNAVGHFALLNSPKIKAYKSSKTNFEWNTLFDQYVSWSRNYQFQLENDIYYAINDINVKSHDVLVAFEIDGQVKHLNPDFSPIYSYIDYPQSINVSSDDVDMNEYYPIAVQNSVGYNGGANFCILTFENDGLCEYEDYTLPNQTYLKDQLSFSTDYFSIDVISPMVFSVGIINQYFDSNYPSNEVIDPSIHGRSLEDIRLKMKLLVNITHHDLDENGENITQTLAFTYDVNNVEWIATPLETDLVNSSVNYSHFEPNLVLNNTNFDGTQVNGCKLVGTHYTCHGWDDVTINGDLTTSGGYTVDIFGANAVYVIGESNISPEIVLDIQSILDYSDPMPRADAAFVRKFCKDELGIGFPSYEANKPTKSAILEYEVFESESQENVTPPALEVMLYPVPTQNTLNIQSSILISGETFVIVDLAGRNMGCVITKLGAKDYTVDVSKLADGAYYLSVFSEQGESKKLFNIIRNQ